MVNHYRFGIFVLFNYSLYKLTYSTVFSSCYIFFRNICHRSDTSRTLSLKHRMFKQNCS